MPWDEWQWLVMCCALNHRKLRHHWLEQNDVVHFVKTLRVMSCCDLRDVFYTTFKTTWIIYSLSNISLLGSDHRSLSGPRMHQGPAIRRETRPHRFPQCHSHSKHSSTESNGIADRQHVCLAKASHWQAHPALSDPYSLRSRLFPKSQRLDV